MQVSRKFAESFSRIYKPRLLSLTPHLPPLHITHSFSARLHYLHCMLPSAKDLVDSHLATSRPNPDARPTTPEQTTQSGVVPENALYDTPPPRRAHNQLSSAREGVSVDRLSAADVGSRLATDRKKSERRVTALARSILRGEPTTKRLRTHRPTALTTQGPRPHHLMLNRSPAPTRSPSPGHYPSASGVGDPGPAVISLDRQHPVPPITSASAKSQPSREQPTLSSRTSTRRSTSQDLFATHATTSASRANTAIHKQFSRSSASPRHNKRLKWDLRDNRLRSTRSLESLFK